MAGSDTLHIIDGNGWIYRAFYAHSGLESRGGEPTGAVFGFALMLRRFLDRSPGHVAMTFDAGRKTFRNAIYPEYKANRRATPEALVTQLPRIRELVAAFNIPVFEQVGVEADDLIASLVRQAKARGLRSVVVSSDKDLMQLIDGEAVVMLDLAKDRVVTDEDVEARFGVVPGRVLEVLALAGDSSDNIPGVPGIGEKTAGKLIAEFGDLETLLGNLDRVSGPKRRQNLDTFREQAFLSRDLVRLKDDCEVVLDLDALRVRPADRARLRTLYADLDFFTLLGQLDGATGEVRRPPEPGPKTYRMITEVEDLHALAARARELGRIAVVAELSDSRALDADIVGLSFAAEPDVAAYVPVGHRYIGAPRQLPLSVVIDVLGELLSDPSVVVVTHDLKRLHLALAGHGVAAAAATDTMLMSYLLDPGETSHKLEAVVARQLGVKTAGVRSRGGPSGPDMADVASAMVAGAAHADWVVTLHGWMAPLLEDTELAKLLTDVELPLTGVLAAMERRGILVDLPLLQQLSVEFEAELRELEAQITEAAGHRFNIKSSKQLATVLFEELGLPVSKRTKSGPSTDRTVLESLASLHPLPALVVEHRSFAKLKSTYVDALGTLADSEGRVHSELNQAVAATGRLSSSNPNLQNIPIRTPRGRRIRQAFRASPGHLLVAADYSQIELRVLAHLSGDETLIEAFEAGDDIHRRTAAEIFDVPLLLVSSEQRRAAKTINFGVIYGMGAVRLAADLGISRGEASRFIESYFGRYGRVSNYFDSLLVSAKRLGYASTLLGRRRPIVELSSPRRHIRALGERLAINTPIQGSAADIIKVAMIALHKRIEDERWPARLLLQVHDELVLETTDEFAEALSEAVATEMSAAVALVVPLVVDVGVGTDWVAAK